MDYFYRIYGNDESKFQVFLNVSDQDLLKKFSLIHRNPTSVNKFKIIIKAIERDITNKTQWNWEGTCSYGEIYAIKIDEHRIYTVVHVHNSIKCLFMCKYGRKQSQKNDKKLNNIIRSISNLSFQKVLGNG